jgi:hypothetical protein
MKDALDRMVEVEMVEGEMVDGGRDGRLHKEMVCVTVLPTS